MEIAAIFIITRPQCAQGEALFTQNLAQRVNASPAHVFNAKRNLLIANVRIFMI